VVALGLNGERRNAHAHAYANDYANADPDYHVDA
jgi:hypothetical protein